MTRRELILFTLCTLFTVGLLTFVPSASGSAVPLPWVSQFDNDAAQMAGGKIYTYAAGTTTLKTTWTDAAKSTTAANPIILDNYGRCVAYGDGLYKLVIKNASDQTITTIDNVELLSVSNPTTIVTTNLTVATMTAAVANVLSGHLASVAIDYASMSNSRIINSVVMNTPTVASNPVPLNYLQAQLAAAAAAVATHTNNSVNPHGTTLTQTTILASAVTMITGVASSVWCDSTATGGIELTATGATVVGGTIYPTLSFAQKNQESRVRVRSWEADPPLLYLDMLTPFNGWKTQVSVDAQGSGTIDFGGAALTNYTSTLSAAGGDLQILEASATPNVYLGYGSATTILSTAVPASFTAGYYEVNWYVLMNNSNGTSANIGQCYLLLSGTTIQQTRNYGFASSSHSYDAGEVSGHRILYLSPAQLVQITGQTLLPPATYAIQASTAYLSFRFLGATKKAL